jgi:hypothetical protein
VMWAMWNLISVHLEIVLVRCKIGARFALNIPQVQKSFWIHPMELLDDVCHVETRFDVFGGNIIVNAR